MTHFSYKCLNKLSLNEVIQEISPNSKHILLNTIHIGPQPMDTIIIGELRGTRKIQRANDANEFAKFIFKEVVPHLSEVYFDILLSQNDAALFEDMFKETGGLFWAIFSNVYIEKIGRPSGKYILKLDPTIRPSPMLYLLHEYEQTYFIHKSMNSKYLSLNDVKDAQLCNIFAVVTKVLKPETKTKTNSRHMLLELIDPSCFQNSASWNSLPLHIFLNESKGKWKEPFYSGDIVRINNVTVCGTYATSAREASNAIETPLYQRSKKIVKLGSKCTPGFTFFSFVGSYYPPTSKMYGRINNMNSLIKFKSEEDDKVTPITCSHTYVLTEYDEAIVRRLRQWWNEVKIEMRLKLQKPSQEKLKISTQKSLVSEVTRGLTFHLECIITGVCHVKQHGVVIFKVTDGTWSRVYTVLRDLENATGNLNSQTECAAFEALEIYITVFNNLEEVASKLKVGDFVLLQNVHACELECGVNLGHDIPFLDFHMGGKMEHSMIKKLYPYGAKYRKIVRCMNKWNIASDQNQEEKPESKTAIQTCLQMVIGEGESPRLDDFPFPESIFSITNAAFSDLEQNKNHSVFKFNGSDETEVNPKGTIPLFKCNTYPSKLEYSMEFWSFEQLPRNGCPSYARSSLKAFFEDSQPGDKCNVMAFLKSIHTIPYCQNVESSYILSLENWVWGLCPSCGNCYSPVALRSLHSPLAFQKDDLLCTNLPCCNRLTLAGTRTIKTPLVPCIRLKLRLEETRQDGEFCATLSGDGAEFFFSCRPSFKWVVGKSVPNALQEKLSLLKQVSRNQLLEFCLVNLAEHNTCSIIQIHETVLKS